MARSSFATGNPDERIFTVSTRHRVFSLGAAIAAVGVWAARLAAPPANTAPPTITGTPRVGETLTAQNGTWSNS